MHTNVNLMDSIMEQTKKHQITAERLNQLMREQYSYIVYDQHLAQEYLDNAQPGPDMDEDMIAYCFSDHLISQDLAEEVVL